MDSGWWELTKLCGQVCESGEGKVIYSDVTQGHSWKPNQCKTLVYTIGMWLCGRKDEGSSVCVGVCVCPKRVEKKDSQKICIKWAAIKETGKGDEHKKKYYKHTHRACLKIVLKVCGVVVPQLKRLSRRRGRRVREKRTMKKRERERRRQASPKLPRCTNTL